MSTKIKILIDFVVLFFIYLKLYRKWKEKNKYVLISNTLMYLYLICVLFVTLMPITASLPFCFNHPYTPMNLSPFDDLFSQRGDYIRQIVLNVFMTVPFGFLLPLCRKCNGKRTDIIYCVLVTAGLSLCIELLQPLINGARSSDITDVITNTSGGFIGYIIYIILLPLINRLFFKNHKMK